MNADELTGERVHLLLRRGGIQQQALADVLGITQTSMSRKLLGKRSWTLDEVLATARFLSVQVADLLPGNDYAPVLEGRGRVGVVRPKGLEPLTFWLVADQTTRAESDALFWSIVCQEFPDNESAHVEAVA